MRKIEGKHVSVYDNWVYVDGVGRIGMYSPYDKAILLDWSMKFIVGTNERIPVDSTSQIVEKIKILFNGQ
jgi:hypothetical protein